MEKGPGQRLTKGPRKAESGGDGGRSSVERGTAQSSGAGEKVGVSIREAGAGECTR